MNIPNTVTCFRMMLYYVGFYMHNQNPWLFIYLYGIGSFLDGIDGYLARKFDQCTKMGQALDMLVDRSSHILLYSMFTSILPQFWLVFSTICLLDVSSHWSLIYNRTNHKSIDASMPYFMTMYYKYSNLMDFTLV